MNINYSTKAGFSLSIPVIYEKGDDCLVIGERHMSVRDLSIYVHDILHTISKRGSVAYPKGSKIPALDAILSVFDRYTGTGVNVVFKEFTTHILTSQVAWDAISSYHCLFMPLCENPRTVPGFDHDKLLEDATSLNELMDAVLEYLTGSTT